MKIILATLVASSCLLQGSPERFNFDSQVGLVEGDPNGGLCLTVSNPNLTNGTAVTFIFPHKPQHAVKAVIDQKVVGSCSRTDVNPNASFYSLKLGAKEQSLDAGEPKGPAIAVVNSVTPVRVQHRVASVDLDRDGQREFFRTCTSNEGIHLTVWSGKPLQGKRRWHSYYYLGYDVVPTCKKKDYE